MAAAVTDSTKVILVCTPNNPTSLSGTVYIPSGTLPLYNAKVYIPTDPDPANLPAIATGVDCFVSGEVSEQTTHLARESGVAYVGAGHHATERYGVQALGAHLASKFGLDVEFVDIDNPV